MRLLSFLSAIEYSLAMDDPEPQGGSWDNTRMINYHEGLARLMLGSKQSAVTQSLGSVLLQSFRLADGSTCLKAFLKWSNHPVEVVQAIYEKPETNWDGEARAIAAVWLNQSIAEPAEVPLAKAV